MSGVITSRYPSMSDATTGVAQANARVSTMPKLSPPSDGATSAFAERSSAVRSSCERKPRMSIPSSETCVREQQQPNGERVGSGDPQARAGAAPDLGPRLEQHAQALARLVAPGEQDPVLAPGGIGRRGDQHSVRDHVVVAR